MTAHVSSFAHQVTETANRDVLGEELGFDVSAALGLSLQAGDVFPKADPPLAFFRQAITDTIGQITKDDRWGLFQRFLKHGPQDAVDMNPERLFQAQPATVISFVRGHAVNSFQGAITELVAPAPCTRILQTLQQEGRLPQEARL